MKIGHKIVLGFFSIALLFVLVGGLHLSRLIQTRGEINTIILTHVKELESSESIFHFTQKAHANTRQLLLEFHHQSTMEDLQPLITRIRHDLQKAGQSLQKLEESSRLQGTIDPHGEEEEQEKVRLLSSQLRNLSALVGRIITALEVDQYNLAVNLTEREMPPLTLGIQSLVSELEVDAEEEIHTTLASAGDEIETSLMVGGLLMLSALIAAFALGRVISRGISDNVRKLEQATAALGEGKLDTRVDIQSADEIGRIAGSINRMAEGLRKAIVSRDDMAREVSERKRVEAQLRSQRSKAQVYLDIVDVLLTALDHQGNITLINRKGCQILGYQEHELIGKNWFELCIVEENRGKVFDVFKRLMAGDVAPVEYHENSILTKNRQQKIIAFHNTVIRNEQGCITGILFSGEDITQHKLAEEALRDSEEQFRLLLNSTEESIYGLDLEGKCTFANIAFLNTLGYSSLSEVIGKDMHAMIHHTRPDGSEYPLDACRACMSFRTGSGTHVDDEVFWRKDGSSIPVSYWSQPVRREQKITGCVVTFLDISERIMARNALQESHDKLQTALEGTVQTIINAVGARDPYTAGHQLRVAKLSTAIAEDMGLGESQVKGIRMGASIHDIGKIQVPAELLSKPSSLNETEFGLIKAHTQTGHDILKDIEFPWPIADIAFQHHERLDGSGYPQGLKGDAICLEARIVAVADVVEAICSHRPYRPAHGIDAALNEIRSQRGTLYDAQVVDSCLRLFSEKGFAFMDEGIGTSR